MTLKVCFTDGLAKKAQPKLGELAGVAAEVFESVDAKDLVAKLSDKDLVVIRSATQLSAAVLGELPKLRGIIRAGVGLDNIDLVRASELGIPVWNAPTGNYQATAELAMALVFALARGLGVAVDAARKTDWAKKSLSGGRQIRGSTLGVVGLGAIGSRVVEMGLGVGMNVVGFDPAKKLDARAGFIQTQALAELLALSDFVSIHVPYLPDTKNFIAAQQIANMKKGSYLINCARGGLVDERALLEALNSGQLSGAGLDVFSKEPFSGDPTLEQLLKHPKVLATPHVGASTVEAQEAVGHECVALIKTLSLALSQKTQAPKSLNNLKTPSRFTAG
jgi:D-3-phosphoglycerate dehydrogenase / 2-oxoglutarate reductase